MYLEYGDPAVALGGEILRSVVGSGVHGIAIADTDDHDEMGVYIEPHSHVLGVEKHRGLGDELRAMRAAFMSRHAVERFLGYMHSQHERMLGQSKRNAPTGRN